MTTTPTHQVRLIKTSYSNRLEWEDGPGSLRNVVSDSSKRRYDLGSMTLEEANTFSRSDVEEELGIYFEEDSADGFEEYSYKLEYLDPATNQWRLIKFLH